MYYIAFGLPLDPEFLRFMKTAYNFIFGWEWKKVLVASIFFLFLLAWTVEKYTWCLSSQFSYILSLKSFLSF